MKLKNIFFATITGLIFGVTYPQHITTNIEFYDDGTHGTSMHICVPGVARSKGVSYHNDAIIIIKDHSNKISANRIGNLPSIENAFITSCSNFNVIEHGANHQNPALCKDIAILQAYEEFKKDYENKEKQGNT